MNPGKRSMEESSGIMGVARRRRAPPVVLLVEDEEDDVDLMLEALKECGVDTEPHVARDGVQAMAFLRKQDGHEGTPIPDLVFLDLDMPRMSGREVLKQVKSDPDLQHIPVVVFSMSESEQDILGCYRSHAAAYVLKPVYFSEFVQVVGSIASFWLDTAAYPERR